MNFSSAGAGNKNFNNVYIFTFFFEMRKTIKELSSRQIWEQFSLIFMAIVTAAGVADTGPEGQLINLVELKPFYPKN